MLYSLRWLFDYLDLSYMCSDVSCMRFHVFEIHLRVPPKTFVDHMGLCHIGPRPSTMTYICLKKLILGKVTRPNICYICFDVCNLFIWTCCIACAHFQESGSEFWEDALVLGTAFPGFPCRSSGHGYKLLATVWCIVCVHFSGFLPRRSGCGPYQKLTMPQTRAARLFVSSMGTW